MKTILALILSAAAFAQAQPESRASFGIMNLRDQQVPELGELATLAGKYSIYNAHSGMSLTLKRFRNKPMLAQDEIATKWTLVPVEGGYLIDSGKASFLADASGRSLITTSEFGTVWNIYQVPDSDTFEIIGVSGRALQAEWMIIPGDWLQLAKRNGASNQEWRIEPAITAMTRNRAEVAHVRAAEFNGEGRQAVALAVARPRANASMSWARDGEEYVYRMRVEGSGMTHVRMFKTVPDDLQAFKEISAPSGWRYVLFMWRADKPASGGIFSLRTKYAPGPVIRSIKGDPGGRVGKIAEGATDHQSTMMGLAAIGRGDHGWAIGPAIPPQADDTKIRELVKGWVSDGLAFLWPLLDEKPIAQSVEELQPETKFEREVAQCLIDFIGGRK